ncbi:MAG: hypothetical protein EOO07_06460 [Chitinophagaceae bacterium]|nr:MAG: hypothetical protein EOO07_06460 [Chitinophagaceae bacterium]
MRTGYFILLLMFLASCSADQCGNELSVYGKYVNHAKANEVNYITLNKDGTYFYFYKKGTEKEKTFRGKWQEFKTEDQCEISFNLWKDIVGYHELDQLSISWVPHRNDKILFFEGLEADYEKVD